MSYSPVYKARGQTVALSVTASAHTAVQITGQGEWASFLNPGSKSVFVAMWQLQPGVPPTVPSAMAFPVDGTNSGVNGFILPPLMTVPMIVDTPAGGFNLSAIGEAAGPTIIYVNRVAV